MNLFSFLSNVLSEDNGNPSTMRIVLLFGAIVIIGTWAFASLKSGVLQPMGNDLITVLGMLLAGKVVQKGQETKPSETKPTT